MTLNTWGVIARYAMMQQDPDLMERAAAGFEATGNKRVGGYVKQLRAQATALRAKQAAENEPPKDEGAGDGGEGK